MIKNQESTRILYFDYLRVLGTIAVITLHVASANWGVSDVNGTDWFVFNFYDSITRWGVPVFLMISGTLFLSREIPIRTIYTKYIFRMLTAYLAWGLAYYLFRGESIRMQLHGLFQSGSLDNWVRILKASNHMWFILMISGIYICYPLLKQIVKEGKLSLYFLAISFLFWFLIPQIVSLAEDFGSDDLVKVTRVLYDKVAKADLSFVTNYSFYFVLGYEVSRRSFRKEIRALIYALGILGFVFTVQLDWFLAIKNQEPFGRYYENNCINVLFEALAVFEFLKNRSLHCIYANKVIRALSKWSFGAYLVHMLVLEQLDLRGINTLSFPSVYSVPVLVMVVFSISFAISALLNCIPIVNKYIV